MLLDVWTNGKDRSMYHVLERQDRVARFQYVRFQQHLQCDRTAGSTAHTPLVGLGGRRRRTYRRVRVCHRRPIHFTSVHHLKKYI